jgi:hypothetical protein
MYKIDLDDPNTVLVSNLKKSFEILQSLVCTRFLSTQYNLLNLERPSELVFSNYRKFPSL